MISGPMGVGKTTVSRALQEILPDNVFLDGDWCWDARPFQVTEETKEMVLDNISCLLKNFLSCSAYRFVIFCWVIPEETIIREILRRADIPEDSASVFSLICTREELIERLNGDIAKGLRTPDVIERSTAYLSRYGADGRILVDTTGKTPGETAEEIVRLCRE